MIEESRRMRFIQSWFVAYYQPKGESSSPHNQHLRDWVLPESCIECAKIIRELEIIYHMFLLHDPATPTPKITSDSR